MGSKKNRRGIRKGKYRHLFQRVFQQKEHKKSRLGGGGSTTRTQDYLITIFHPVGRKKKKPNNPGAVIYLSFISRFSFMKQGLLHSILLSGGHIQE